MIDLLLFSIIWSLGTERRRVQRKVHAMTADVREASERLDLAQQAAQSGTWDLDLQTGHLFWDARMHELYDVDQAAFDVDLAAWQERLHPGDRDRVAAERQKAVDSLGRFDTVFRIRDRHGKLRFIQAHATVHTDDSGTAQRLIG